MKAIISEKYGTPETLQLKEVPKPEVKSNQVLIKVHASSINYSNLVLLTGKPRLARLAFGMKKPKYPIPGGDVSGIVEAIGEDVTNFQVEDEVYGDLGASGWGTFAEYVATDANAIALKPSNVSHQEAAAVPMAAMTALQALRDKGKVHAGQEVLIYGASGGVGTYSIQIAKAFGANVTAVVSTRNVHIAKSLGASKVIDYKKDDFIRDASTYDVIIGVNGSQSLFVYKKKLKENGVFIHVGGAISQMYQALVLRPLLSMSGKKFMTFLQKPNQADLDFLTKLIEEEKVKSVIDRTYPLEEVPQALDYFSEGHSKGKVVVVIS